MLTVAGSGPSAASEMFGGQFDDRGPSAEVFLQGFLSVAAIAASSFRHAANVGQTLVRCVSAVKLASVGHRPGRRTLCSVLFGKSDVKSSVFTGTSQLGGVSHILNFSYVKKLLPT